MLMQHILLVIILLPILNKSLSMLRCVRKIMVRNSINQQFTTIEHYILPNYSIFIDGSPQVGFYLCQHHPYCLNQRELKRYQN